MNEKIKGGVYLFFILWHTLLAYNTFSCLYLTQDFILHWGTVSEEQKL